MNTPNDTTTDPQTEADRALLAQADATTPGAYESAAFFARHGAAVMAARAREEQRAEAAAIATLGVHEAEYQRLIDSNPFLARGYYAANRAQILQERAQRKGQ